MDYYQFQIKCSAELVEILIAFFSNSPFDTFEDTEYGFNAYIAKDLYSESIESHLNSLKEQFNFNFKKEYIPYQNWNKQWESNFQAIQIGKFCGIRADFHPPFKGVIHEIIINPKMAFGTGHHATTYLVLSIMANLDFDGKKIFDYGCGTGVLAILASKLGAKVIDALDIDILSYENTLENCEVNKVKNVSPYHGTLEKIVHKDYDIILANINRNVILMSLEELYLKLKPNGILLISGFITEDEGIMVESCTKVKFQIQNKLEKDNWLCFQLKK